MSGKTCGNSRKNGPVNHNTPAFTTTRAKTEGICIQIGYGMIEVMSGDEPGVVLWVDEGRVRVGDRLRSRTAHAHYNVTRALTAEKVVTVEDDGGWLTTIEAQFGDLGDLNIEVRHRDWPEDMELPRVSLLEPFEDDKHTARYFGRIGAR